MYTVSRLIELDEPNLKKGDLDLLVHGLLHVVSNSFRGKVIKINSLYPL